LYLAPLDLGAVAKVQVLVVGDAAAHFVADDFANLLDARLFDVRRREVSRVQDLRERGGK
jgi:hypothetical protein